MGLGTSKIDDSQYILFDLADVHSPLLAGSLQSADGNFFFATSAETKSTASPAARGSSVRPAEGRSHFVPPVPAAVRTAFGSAVQPADLSAVAEAVSTARRTAQPKPVLPADSVVIPTASSSRQPVREAQPRSLPSELPSQQPIAAPSGRPREQPRRAPTSAPFSRPSLVPSQQPTEQPSKQPRSRPSAAPSQQPRYCRPRRSRLVVRAFSPLASPLCSRLSPLFNQAW